MPFELHSPTLALAVCLMAPLLAAGDLVVWYQTREKAMLWWALGSLLSAAATALPQMSGHDLLLGDALLALSFGAYWGGIRCFQRRALPGTLPALAWGIAGLAALVVLASAPPGGHRPAAFLILIAGLSTACAFDLLARHRKPAREASRFVGLLFSVNALFFLALGVLAPFVGSAPAIAPEVLDLAARIELLTLLIGWNFGFVMMAMQHYLDLATELATHDDLTGVLNRRALEERARQHIKLADRGGPTLSLLVMDLDHFKSINDSYGHQAGDAVLMEFVRIAESCLRAPDQFGRVGGEEFVALLPATRSAGALTVAERLRQKLAETPIAYGGRSINATVSIGAAEYDSRQHDFDSLMHAADKALYRAKGRGRNCVEVAAHAGAAPPAVQLVWDGRHTSGHPLIDTEHECLFRMVNELIRNAQEQPDIQALYKDLKEMLFWLSEHFRHEEEIFLSSGWSGARAHMDLHRQLERRGEKMLDGIRDDSQAFGDLLDFLIREVVGIHLAQHDTHYFSAIVSRKG